MKIASFLPPERNPDYQIEACRALKAAGVTDVVIRADQCSNDHLCSQIKQIVTDTGLSPAVLMVTEADDHSKALICAYLRVHTLVIRHPVIDDAVLQTVKAAGELGIVTSVNAMASGFEKAFAAGAKLYYDPAHIMSLNRRSNPYDYWAQLARKVSVIYVNDYKLKFGPILAGDGDCDIRRTIVDSAMAPANGWYLIDPWFVKTKMTTVTAINHAYSFLTNLLVGVNRAVFKQPE